MKKASDLVQGFFETYGIQDDKNYAGFMAAWKDIIGERLASHSRPSDVKAGTLIVAVDHPGWMTHIRMAERETIKKIQKRFPLLGVANLAFQLVDHLPPPSRGKTAIDQAEFSRAQAPISDFLNASANENDEINAEKASDIIGPPTDKSNFLSAMAKLRSAMEKKSSG